MGLYAPTRSQQFAAPPTLQLGPGAACWRCRGRQARAAEWCSSSTWE